ncbi:MAG: heme ABC transporter ATP-binding protein, partial [Chloroflexota bacterium]
KPEAGRVVLKERDVTGADPHSLRRAGMAYIPEDRHQRGLVLPFSLTENILLGNSEDPPFNQRGWINYAVAERTCRRLLQEFDVRAPGPRVPASTLSGGNQQKLIIARELMRQPDVLLAVQPTRGLDVGAIEFVHRQLVLQRDQQRAILLVSFDLDEILDLSDRILVMYRGRIVGEFPSGTASRTELGLLMGGRTGDERSTGHAAD